MEDMTSSTGMAASRTTRFRDRMTVGQRRTGGRRQRLARYRREQVTRCGQDQSRDRREQAGFSKYATTRGRHDSPDDREELAKTAVLASATTAADGQEA